MAIFLKKFKFFGNLKKGKFLAIFYSQMAIFRRVSTEVMTHPAPGPGRVVASRLVTARALSQHGPGQIHMPEVRSYVERHLHLVSHHDLLTAEL